MTTAILPAPGLYPNVPTDVYNDWPALRTSHLKAALQSWYHFRRAELSPSEDTEAFVFGRACHQAAFEPAEYAANFWVPPSFDARTTEGKATRATVQADPRTQLSQDEADEIAAIMEAIRADKDAAKLLSLPGQSEVSMVWADPKTGIVCKGRIDRLIKRKNGYLIVDLKTTADASPWKFAASADKLGYDLQAAQYVDGLRACTGAEEIVFLWLAVEKKTQAVAVYSATDPDTSPDFLTNGKRRRDRLLRELIECRRSNVYPSYTKGITPLRVPSYRIEEEVTE